MRRRIITIIASKFYVLGGNLIQSSPSGSVFYKQFPDPRIMDYVGHCWVSSQFSFPYPAF